MAASAQAQGPKWFSAVSNLNAKGASSLRRIAGDGEAIEASRWWRCAKVIWGSGRERIREMRVDDL